MGKITQLLVEGLTKPRWLGGIKDKYSVWLVGKGAGYITFKDGKKIDFKKVGKTWKVDNLDKDFASTMDIINHYYAETNK